jgi:hypothetical protein
VSVSPIARASRATRDLVGGLRAAQQPPVFIAGLPRTGTSWIASIVNTARGVKYLHEPFNCVNVAGAAPMCLKYLGANDNAFVERGRDAFAGTTSGPYVRARLSGRYAHYPWWPGRLVIKDVCACLAVEWVERHFVAGIVMVIRHPCAVADSWLRLGYDVDLHLRRLLDQPALLATQLGPFEHLLRDAKEYCEKVAALWGATYSIMLRQQRAHPRWTLVQHEELCRKPLEGSRQLFERSGLEWTAATDEFLERSTSSDAGRPYAPQRVSADEPDKWRTRLHGRQVDQVRRFVAPFEIDYYSDFWTGGKDQQ